jgi:hypothetical protein
MDAHKKHREILKAEENIIKSYKDKDNPISKIVSKFDISEGTLFNILRNNKIKLRGVIKKWTPKQIEWLKNNYSKNGPKKCAKDLGLTRRQVSKIATTHGLKMDKRSKRELMRTECVNNKKYYPIIKEFLTITKPEIAYFLGYFWADGHLFKKTNSIKIVIEESDALNIAKIFNNCGNWGIYKVTNNCGTKGIAFQFTDYYLHEFLKRNDYLVKSGASADKILSRIPERLKHYWWRGYFDGDGSIDGKTTLSITSVFDQRWLFYKKLCKKLHITYRIYRRIRKDTGSKYSTVNITKRSERDRFCDYIYRNYKKDKIGLERKYNKYKSYKTT